MRLRTALPETLLEEVVHHPPGALGRTLVVDAVRWAVGIRFREAVHCPGEVDELPVGVDGIHLLLETRDLLRADAAVVGTVEHQDRRRDR